MCVNNPLLNECGCWLKFLCREQANVVYAITQNSFLFIEVILSLYHAWMAFLYSCIGKNIFTNTIMMKE